MLPVLSNLLLFIYIYLLELEKECPKNIVEIFF